MPNDGFHVKAVSGESRGESASSPTSRHGGDAAHAPSTAAPGPAAQRAHLGGARVPLPHRCAGRLGFSGCSTRDHWLVVDRSGIVDLSTVTRHTLRHTAATQWLRHGADVFSVSRRLGHASAAFTMDVYGHLLKGQQHQAAEALDHVLA